MLSAAVASIEKHSGPRLGRIIIVDDCSTEGGIREFAQEHGRYVRLRARGGFAVAVNEGAAMVSGDRFVLFNSDVEAVNSWLDPLIEMLDSDPKLAVVGPLLTFPEGMNDPARPSGKVQSCGFAINAIGLPFHRLLGWSPTNPKVMQPRTDLQGITGAVWLVRRSAWRALNGMEKTFVCYYEDADFCIRAKVAGWKIGYQPLSHLTHFTGATTTTALPQQEMSRLMSMNGQNFQQRTQGKVQYDEYLLL